MVLSVSHRISVIEYLSRWRKEKSKEKTYLLANVGWEGDGKYTWPNLGPGLAKPEPKNLGSSPARPGHRA